MLQLKENRVVKDGEHKDAVSAFVAHRLRAANLALFADFLVPEVTLIPVPRSGLQRRGSLWPSLEIAQSLHAEGFGAGVLAALRRASPVAKAATSSSNNRPRARAHMESLELVAPLELPRVVTLVDDVVTRGAQLFGAAWRIWQERPDIVVRAFAVVRTESDPEKFQAIRDPKISRIEWRHEECARRP